jgi:hypothetical protein
MEESIPFEPYVLHTFSLRVLLRDIRSGRLREAGTLTLRESATRVAWSITPILAPGRLYTISAASQDYDNDLVALTDVPADKISICGSATDTKLYDMSSAETVELWSSLGTTTLCWVVR